MSRTVRLRLSLIAVAVFLPVSVGALPLIGPILPFGPGPLARTTTGFHSPLSAVTLYYTGTNAQNNTRCKTFAAADLGSASTNLLGVFVASAPSSIALRGWVAGVQPGDVVFMGPPIVKPAVGGGVVSFCKWRRVR